jgi:zinc protease
MKRFGILGLMAALLLPLAAQADEVSSFTLDNGMQVVVIEDHRAPVVVQMVWYRIGAADEAPGHSGIAHFLEHLMFQGTETLAPGEFSATVEAQGGNDNAFTSWDYTAYYQRVAADRLDLVMRMEADRMRNLKLTEEDVVTERQVILEERNQRTDSSPGALLTEQMNAAQYLNHPYGRPVIGWRHEMEGLSRQDALDWYQAYYAPNNAILVVAGDVEPEAVLALAKTHYGPIAPSDRIKERIRPAEPPQIAERRMVYADERVSEPYLIRSYLAPSRRNGDPKQAAALVMLAQLLGGNPTTSVLVRALQFDTQTAVYTSAFYSGTAMDSDTFGFVVMPVPGVTLEAAEGALDKVVETFMTDGVNAEDLARIKAQVRAEDIYNRDDTEGLARQYGQALTVGLSIEDIQAWPGLLQAVTAEDIMAAAAKVLNRDQAVTGWLTGAEEATE